MILKSVGALWILGRTERRDKAIPRTTSRVDGVIHWGKIRLHPLPWEPAPRPDLDLAAPARPRARACVRACAGIVLSEIAIYHQLGKREA